VKEKVTTTAQFRIDRPSQGEFPAPHETYPYVVWVEYPPVRSVTYICRCADKIYRVLDESAQEICAVTGQRWQSGMQFFVCPCMGEVIE
jgi:hypothetical protein